MDIVKFEFCLHQQQNDFTIGKTVEIDHPCTALFAHAVTRPAHLAQWPDTGDTGYYNEQDWFPVFTIDRMTMRYQPIYHST